MKNARQRRIIALINELDIETQDELLERLIEEGFPVTQSTISRDMKDLKLTKTLTYDGKYKYTSMVNLQYSGKNGGEAKFQNILKEAVISVAPAKNLAVIKTYPGMAQAAGAAVDAMQIEEIVGSVAGDDTLLIIFADDDDCFAVAQNIKNVIGG